MYSSTDVINGREAQQQAHQRGESHHHNGVIQGDLGEREKRVAIGQSTPHKHHRRAGRRGKQNQPRDVAIDLIGRQERGKKMANKYPPEERHGEGLYEPIHEERDPDALYMAPYLSQGAKVHLHQHWDDHDPDEQTHGQVDLGDREAADEMKDAGEKLPEGNSHDDTEKHPHRQIPLEHTHGEDSSSGVLPMAAISSVMRN